MTEQKPILLQSKLHRPSVPRFVIDRPQLIEQLNNAIYRPLTLVCAAAGFGKTTLVSAWLEHRAIAKSAVVPIPAAWLSLDAGDSDPNLFIRYTIAALRTIFADACEKTLVLLQAGRRPPQSVVFAMLSNEIEQLPDDFILVLDDYHTIDGLEVHDLLNEWARHWPKPLHLVLISRISPPLPLASLRAKGIIGEIRTNDLRFSPQETNAYFDQRQIEHLSQSDFQLLDERLGGWIAGLQLAAISLHLSASQQTVLSVLSAENANITDYLVDEVLLHQLPVIQTFLLKTSILNRFCAALCEAVIGELDPAWSARACLDWVDRSELFIVHLDNRQQWYRYQDLFQELLQQRLSAETTPDHIAGLHHRASIWFEAQDLLDEAIHHALAAKDLDRAAGLIERGMRDVFIREDQATIVRWLRLLPDDYIQRRPGLLINKAWISLLQALPDKMAENLRRVELLLDSDGVQNLKPEELDVLHGRLALGYARLAFFQNQTDRAVALGRQAYTMVPETWGFERSRALMYLGMSLHANGQAQDAERLLLRQFEALDDKRSIEAIGILVALGFNRLQAGQFSQAVSTFQMVLRETSYDRIATLRIWALFFMAEAYYQLNDLDATQTCLAEIVEHRYSAVITHFYQALAGIALIAQIRGREPEAWQILEQLSQLELEQFGSESPATQSLRAHLWFLQGDLERAGIWADSFNLPVPNEALVWIENPHLTRVRILLARNAVDDSQNTLAILETLAEIAERTHNTRNVIEILAMRAVALENLGESNAANAALMQALDLARPGGGFRVFVDLGNPMRAMLQGISQQAHHGESIQHILAAFPQDIDDVASPWNPKKQLPEASTFMEPLTRRELEILSLLRGPLSNKEIAAKLDISTATVKRHIINLYGKLGVNRRRQAVAKAEELNILSTP